MGENAVREDDGERPRFSVRAQSEMFGDKI